jgi:hypothetical protein
LTHFYNRIALETILVTLAPREVLYERGVAGLDPKLISIIKRHVGSKRAVGLTPITQFLDHSTAISAIGDYFPSEKVVRFLFLLYIICY